MAEVINDIKFKTDMFLDRLTTIYGESGTGKSTIMMDALYHLNPFVDQIFVFAPTDKQNSTYSGKNKEERIVPLPCIHYDLTEEKLSVIWERQSAIIATHARANNVEVVDRLAKRIKNPDFHKILNKINKSKKTSVDELESRYTGIELEDKKSAVVTKLDEYAFTYKKHQILKERRTLKKMKITEDERFTLRYLGLNPRTVIIFDDCTDKLNEMKRSQILQKIAYQGRHLGLTVFIACHTDKCLDPALKKNAFISIFTEKSCLEAYINRASNDLDREQKKYIRSCSMQAFCPSSPHQKLMFAREQKIWGKFTADRRRGFKFGSQTVWDFCEGIESEGEDLSNNKFAAKFK